MWWCSCVVACGQWICFSCAYQFKAENAARCCELVGVSWKKEETNIPLSVSSWWWMRSAWHRGVFLVHRAIITGLSAERKILFKLALYQIEQWSEFVRPQPPHPIHTVQMKTRCYMHNLWRYVELEETWLVTKLRYEKLYWLQPTCLLWGEFFARAPTEKNWPRPVFPAQRVNVLLFSSAPCPCIEQKNAS